MVYDVENGLIKNIPGLIFNKVNSKFTIKKNEKGSSLKNLAPKTMKHKKHRSKEEKKKHRSKEEKKKLKSKEEKKKHKTQKKEKIKFEENVIVSN